MATTTIPDDRSYTEEHEWVLVAPGAGLPDTPVRVGITSVAAAALGDLVYVDLPEVGSAITAGETCGEVESTKTVSELYPPVSGTVTAVNSDAVDDPSIITADPYDAGWLFEVQAIAAGNLLTAAEYAARNEG
ncbi:glycine cleavage system protein GcvH [Mycolicibacterium llatzerense]|uniref:glycine cleavage system protein GcvH n=1 Tax=Mycolicibacterium llatzerense TaxID=280871 RepID=UPI0021B50E7C|nr:glycine cleavage system protein GcvH [Mycolicibacterium llatzerense]MCT7364444.1 glycine cleavage system protein H [Mycolicibacterium llatzerense]MCT7372841.1 glycine cleavage system protein H [Mycolicibacterium llatzerense]